MTTRKMCEPKAMPQILIVQLLRWTSSGDLFFDLIKSDFTFIYLCCSEKNNKKITSTEKLQLFKETYTLSGTIIHHGGTNISGHYVSFSYKNAMVFELNDSVVKTLDERKTIENPYILFYNK